MKRLLKQFLVFFTSLSFMFFIMGLQSMIEEGLWKAFIIWAVILLVLIAICWKSKALEAFDD